MKIYTFQPLSLALKLQKEKVLVAEKELVNPVKTPPCEETQYDAYIDWLSEHSWLREPYNWMKDQMLKRIGIPDHLDVENTYPFWGWRSDFSKILINSWDTYEIIPATERVIIGLEIDKTRILCSNFEAWELVIDEFYLDVGTKWKELYRKIIKTTPLKKEDIDTNKSIKHNLKLHAISPIEKLENYSSGLVKEYKKSWENIFDLNFCLKFLKEERTYQKIQATFWELKWDDVIELKIKGGNIKNVITVYNKNKDDIINFMQGE